MRICVFYPPGNEIFLTIMQYTLVHMYSKLLVLSTVNVWLMASSTNIIVALVTQICMFRGTTTTIFNYNENEFAHISSFNTNSI